MQPNSLKLTYSNWSIGKNDLNKIRLVAATDTDLNESSYNFLSQFLSTEEELFLSKKYYALRKYQFLLGRLCAKISFQKNTGSNSFSEIALIPQLKQPPIIKGNPGFGVSITHSSALAISCCYSKKYPVSVDLEFVRPDLRKILPIISQHESKEILSNLPKKEFQAATILWSAKESRAKLAAVSSIRQVTSQTVVNMIDMKGMLLFQFKGDSEHFTLSSFTPQFVISISQNIGFSSANIDDLRNFTNSISSWLRKGTS